MIEIPYNHELFVGRQEPLDKILQRARSLLKENEPDRSKVLQLTGSKGTGKSWLLCEAARRLEKLIPDILLVHLILGADNPGDDVDCSLHLAPDRTRETPNDSVGQILEHLASQLPSSEKPPVAIDELSWWFQTRWQQHGRPLVLLVDGIDEAPTKFLHPLDQYVLAPLATATSALIVLGGRVLRQPGGFVWTALELRGAERIKLAPFNQKEVVEQLDKLAQHKRIERQQAKGARQIQERGGGYPLTNAILAQHWPNLSPALQECAEIHLANVPKTIRPHFWALCVLTDFDDYRIGPLLCAWSAEQNQAWSGRARQVRISMVDTRLVRWDRDLKVYVIDEAVRKVLEEALRDNQPARWNALHRAAYKLYADWARQYPDPRWDQARDYHENQLKNPRFAHSQEKQVQI